MLDTESIGETFNQKGCLGRGTEENAKALGPHRCGNDVGEGFQLTLGSITLMGHLAL